MAGAEKMWVYSNLDEVLDEPSMFVCFDIKSKTSSSAIVNTWTARGQFLNWTSNTDFVIAMLGSKKTDNI